MNARYWSLGLGAFSIALGMAELFGAGPMARRLGQDHALGRGTLRLFGLREMVAGTGILAAPAHSTRMWNRVAGDAMDLAALAVASRRRPLWGPIAFVLGATAADIAVARALDRSTGKMLPGNAGVPQPTMQAHPRPVNAPTTIEPDDLPLHQAPAVPQRSRR